MDTYDVVVLGGGPGGYAAAIRSSRLGMRTAIVEQDKLGGTCLHRGCIPSKTLLRSAELFDAFAKADQFGIRATGVELDFAAVLGRKDAVVRQLHEGVKFLMKKNKIDVIEGRGEIEQTAPQADGGNGVVRISRTLGETIRIAYRDLIIATGSRPRTLPGIRAHERIMTSDDALCMTGIPASIVIIGGGAIGVEWASMLRDFGSEVTIVEVADRLLPAEDEDVSRELQRLLTKRKIKVMTGVKLGEDGVSADDNGARVSIERRNGETESLPAERVLVSIGRAANVEGFGLERTRARVDRGAIAVDEAMRTDEPHVYAVGDVIGGLQLAHAASREGKIAADAIAGASPLPLDPRFVPKCVYGRPEIASIGWTEKEAIAQGFAIRAGKVSFKAIGKALVYGESDGFVKVIFETGSHTVIGVHMIGPHVTELIGQAGMAQICQATAEQIGSMVYAHPTLNESFGEAVLEWM